MRYLIIGNGVAGITAAFTLRQRDANSSITVVGGESEYFYSRTALMYAFLDRLPRHRLEPHERSVYRRRRIDLVHEWVVDLDADRREVTLRSGGVLQYDRLLIATGSRPRVPGWEGWNDTQTGVVNFVSLQDLDRCEASVKRGGEAIVVGGGLIGIELAECLSHHGMRVTFLLRDPWFWPIALNQPEAEMVRQHMLRHGVDVVSDVTVDHVLTKSEGGVIGLVDLAGRRWPCDLLGVAIGVRPNIDWLRPVKTPPKLGRGILTDDGFRASLPGVFAAGDCAEIERTGHPSLLETIWYSAKRQGELAGRSMMGDEIRYQPPLFFNSSKFFDIEFTTVGEMQASDSESFYVRDPKREISIRLVHRNGCLVGANLLGSRWNHACFERWIEERRGLDYVLEHLAQAQFDVEFGRSDLSFVARARESGRNQ